MKDLVRRFARSVVYLVRPAPAVARPYSCVYVAGPVAVQRGAEAAA